MAKKTPKKDSNKNPEMMPNGKSPANKASKVPISAPSPSPQNKKKVKPTPATVASSHVLAKKRANSLPAAPSTSPQSKKKIDRSMSEPVIATSSKAKQSQPPLATLIPVRPGLNKRFYEALVLSVVLGKNRGDRINEAEDFESGPGLSILQSDRQRRRSFLKHLAYLCDYEKGGDRTTAIALQNAPEHIVYWFASNKSPEKNDKAAVFMRDILQSLRCVDEKEVARLESELFAKAVKFSARRIMNYASMLEGDIGFVLEELAQSRSLESTETDSKFVVWLQKIKQALRSPREICQLCYDSRRSEEYASLNIRGKAGASCANRYENIRHIVGRLNHTMKAVKDVVAAGIYLPALFDNFEVSRIKSSERSLPPLQERKPTLIAIAGRMLSDRNEIAHYREALDELDTKFELSKRLKEECTSPSWRPKVHAELLVLDLFHTQELEFVDKDRFIACSKPACYCCYHYIKAHPGGFAIPASHGNCFLRWRTPDIYDSSRPSLVKTREDILNAMTQDIRKEVLNQIRERRGPRTNRPDSLTEISSLRLEDPTFAVQFTEKPNESSSDDEEGSSDEEEGTSGEGEDEYDLSGLEAASDVCVGGFNTDDDDDDDDDDASSVNGDEKDDDTDDHDDEEGGVAL